MRKQRIFCLVHTLILLSLCVFVFSQTDDYDEYVRQVLEEERNAYGDDYYDDPHQDPEDIRIEREAARKAEEYKLKEEQKRAEAHRQEQIRLKREAEFEAELKKMNDTQKKLALKQRKMDSKLVKRILNAFSQEKYYAVLGLRNMEFHVGPFKIFGKAFGPWTFLQITPKNVKGAYRSRSKATHPDKNKDDRATAAFIAVEEAATILLDEKLKAEYDEMLRLAFLERRRQIISTIHLVTNTVKAYCKKMWWVFRSIFGPFAYPILVLTALIA